MLECLIIGDSIAHGVAMQRHVCSDYGHVGWTSKQVNRHYKTYVLDADTVVISLGTNDNAAVDTYGELSQLRSRIHAKRVIWIIPADVNPRSGTTALTIQNIVSAVATMYKDHTLTIPKPLADHYHPTGKGYKQLAKEAGL
jgi:lysophospholipase L1-like esterase